MIQAKNLDNQNFEDISERAVSRIPNYSDNWTNFNLTDPGITLIDLLSWYKEMEQYEINFYSDEIAERLLRLTGMRRGKSRPAEAMIQIDDKTAGFRPKYSRLMTKEGIIFETEEIIPEKIPKIKKVFIKEKGSLTEVSDILKEGVGIHPFSEFEKEKTELVLEFDEIRDDSVMVSFDVLEHSGRVRNEPDEFSETPRVIFWHWEGSSSDCLMEDETNALSKSGRIKFKVQGKRLVGEIRDAGCEEEVTISRIKCGDIKIKQKRTIAKTEYKKIARGRKTPVELTDFSMSDYEVSVFLRTERGWEQIPYEAVYRDEGVIMSLTVDSSGAKEDDGENLRISYAEALLYEDLFFDSSGMPKQEIQLTLNGMIPLEDSFVIIADTLMPDGSISEEEWREVTDFHSSDERSRVFVYDRENEKIIFGDGKKGAIIPRGEKAILIAGMELSECSGGNIPKNAGLKFVVDEKEVENSEAYFGRDREEIRDMMMRCRNRINSTRKCVTVADFERAAYETAGLRVGNARAVPGFDRQEPTMISRYPVVTIVVTPDSDREKPMPDERFLNAVRRNIEDRRIIGTLVRVSGPVYIPIDLRMEALTSGNVSEEKLKAKIRQALTIGRQRKIGDSVFEGDIEAAASELDEILTVTRIEISTSSPECYKDAYGYLEIPKDGIPWLRSLRFRG